MLKGIITCKCGQLFGFDTTEPNVHCPTCGNEYSAALYGSMVVDVEPEELTVEEG